MITADIYNMEYTYRKKINFLLKLTNPIQIYPATAAFLEELNQPSSGNGKLNYLEHYPTVHVHIRQLLKKRNKNQTQPEHFLV